MVHSLDTKVPARHRPSIHNLDTPLWYEKPVFWLCAILALSGLGVVYVVAYQLLKDSF